MEDKLQIKELQIQWTHTRLKTNKQSTQNTQDKDKEKIFQVYREKELYTGKKENGWDIMRKKKSEDRRQM